MKRPFIPLAIIVALGAIVVYLLHLVTGEKVADMLVVLSFGMLAGLPAALLPLLTVWLRPEDKGHRRQSGMTRAGAKAKATADLFFALDASLARGAL